MKTKSKKRLKVFVADLLLMGGHAAFILVLLNRIHARM